MKSTTRALLAAIAALSQPAAANVCDMEQVNYNHHSLFINEHGDLLAVNNGDFPDKYKPGSIVPASDEKNYINEIYQKMGDCSSKAPTLAIFIHGGLNNFEGASELPEKFSKAMLKQGYYPLFIGWNSGGLVNYKDHLIKLRRGNYNAAIGAITFPFVLLEDVARSVAHAPVAIYKELENPITVLKSLSTDEEKDAMIRRAAIVNNDTGSGKGITLFDYPKYTGVGSRYSTVLNPIKLVAAPFVDGLGKGAWNSMLRRTSLFLSKQSAYQGNGASYIREPDETDTAATKILRKLESKMPNGITETNLIGHSMGSIIANNIITRHPNIPINNIVYMGAASSIQSVENTVVPWLRAKQHENARFYNLSLDPYSELSERIVGYDILPRGSLLVWIDNTFADINSFKDRTAGSWWNIVRSALDIFPPDVRSRITLTRFPIGSGKNQKQGPQSHGDFNDYCFWRPEFWESYYSVPFSPEKPNCMLEKREMTNSQ